MINAGRRLLELGCGTGESTLSLAPSVHEILSSDFSKQMIVRAQSKLEYSKAKTKVSLAIFDAQCIPARDATFDGAFSRGALLNYVPTPDKMLAEINRVLVPDGNLFFDMITRRPGGEARLYSPTQVETLLKNSGFSQVTFRPIGMFVNLWRNKGLMDFANKHRDIFCKIEIEMSDAFRLERSAMTLVTARKSDHAEA